MAYSKEYKKNLSSTCMKLLHFALTIVLFWIFWMLFRYETIFPTKDIGFRYNHLTAIGYAVGIFFFNRTYNTYLLGYSRIRDLVFRQFLSQFFTITIIYIGVSLGWNHWKNPAIFLLLLVSQMVLDVAWSYFCNGFFYKMNPTKKTVLIYRNELDKTRFGNIKGKPSERLYTITDTIQYNGRFADLKDRITGYEAIFVAGINSECRNGILKYCKEKGIPGFFLPHVGDVIMQEAIHIQSFDTPVMYVTRTTANPEYRIIKRAFDFTASLLGIILLSPILLVTALAVKLYDGGPAFYKQTRLTRDGKEFKIIKFRSMRVDAEKDGVARLSSGENDSRITPIGRIVRKCRLDELPQLFNILKGDMSIVGPRPERPEIAEQYYKTIPDFKLRLQVKAGLTGYAQVYGKYNTEPYEKLQFDLLYINNMSILTDLKLMFATAGILFSHESTEGVAVGATTAMDYENVTGSTESGAETVNRID